MKRKVPFPNILRKPVSADAWKNAAAKRRARPDLQQKQDESGHGDRTTYAYWFCRCGECTEANTRYTKETRLAETRAGKRMEKS